MRETKLRTRWPRTDLSDLDLRGRHTSVELGESRTESLIRGRGNSEIQKWATQTGPLKAPNAGICGRAASFDEIAQRENKCGNAPADLTVSMLARTLPHSWAPKYRKCPACGSRRCSTR
jgi:hypothetical protein